MEQIKDRFLRYVAIDTQSNEESDSQPSADKELNLLRLLKDELCALGVKAELDEWGYVMASIPSNIDKKTPAVGFIAHVDTAPDASGADIKPQIISNYDGSDIPLKGVPGLSLKVSDFPELLSHKGETIITTDGTTLLGADDKAGVAEIMDAVQYIMEHPEFKHGEIKIGFTPDEEIGCGANLFDVKGFGAQYAYTVDGGTLGELEYENFNAASAEVVIHGVNIHPGDAKNKMKNACLMAAELIAMVPPAESPAHTEGYEGFYHLCGMEGDESEAKLSWILRDHDWDSFEARKQTMQRIGDYLNGKYGPMSVEVRLTDSYYNMKEKILPHPELLDWARAAFRQAGVEPVDVPIRGGTDGARLSFLGLPCPNLSTGGYHFHGVYEYIPVESLEKMTETLVNLVTGIDKIEKH